MLTLIIFSAIGGSLSGLLDLIKQITAWKEARRAHLERLHSRADRPAFSDYWDPAPEVVSMVAHMCLGAALGALLAGSDQINDSWAACLVGASAPTFITRVVGGSRAVQRAINDPGSVAASPTHSTSQEPVSPPVGSRAPDSSVGAPTPASDARQRANGSAREEAGSGH